MAEDKPRLARLTAIITQLQSKKMVTAREIADKHQVSIRTVYRDIRTLEQSGIPIITDEGKGYTLTEGFSLPPVFFSEEETNALVTAQQIIANNPDESLVQSFDAALEKIKALLRYSQKETTELLAERLQVRKYSKSEDTSEYLILLQKAITQFLLAELTYVSAKEEQTTRAVEPFALIQTQENWLLIAYCRLRNDFRAFRLDRMERLVLKSTRFEPHNLTLEDFFEERKKMWASAGTPDTPMAQGLSTFGSNQSQ
ncbi:MAG: YafY family protein [Bacteroidota bacterium]